VKPWSLLLAVEVTALTLSSLGCHTRRATQPDFTVVEATIPEMQDAMAEGRTTSRQIVQEYLSRIAVHNGKLGAAITVNPDALEEAEDLDRERAQGRVRGRLHGIPIALKDNIHTTDMPTTGGALAFEGLMPPYEATLTRNLREAGAIILAKTSMTELANWVAGSPTPMPANYNTISGFGMSPYDPRRDPRDGYSDGRPALTPGGSSSGIGTAANLWAANVGTETTGSVLFPASRNMLVAIKPTVGRISRHGVIPISSDQDTPGPMAKSVTDAAILLGFLEGAAPDPHDSATRRCAPIKDDDYLKLLQADGLKGARLGIPRAFYYDSLVIPGANERRGGLTDTQAVIMSQAMAILKRQGAVVVDPADIPSVIDTAASGNLIRWGVCSGADQGEGRDGDCSVVLKYGMKRDFNSWLASLGALAPVKSLTELRKWNLAHERSGAMKYGQARLDISDEIDLEADRSRYQDDRAKDLLLSATRGVDAVLDSLELDALVFPGWSGADIAARAGYPTVIVPFGRVPNEPTPAFPTGFAPEPMPLGVSFAGRACSEPRLLGLAYAFEQATRHRAPPEPRR
jgi:amidase